MSDTFAAPINCKAWFARPNNLLSMGVGHLDRPKIEKGSDAATEVYYRCALNGTFCSLYFSTLRVRLIVKPFFFAWHFSPHKFWGGSTFWQKFVALAAPIFYTFRRAWGMVRYSIITSGRVSKLEVTVSVTQLVYGSGWLTMLIVFVTTGRSCHDWSFFYLCQVGDEYHVTW